MLRIPRDHAYQDHAPAYRRLLGKPQRLERNLNDHQIAIAVELGSGMPDRIEGIVGALVLRPESILLDAIRVRIEHVRMALVMEGIQPQSYLVIVVNQLAPQHARADLFRFFIKGQKHGVKVLVGITQVRFGWLADGSAILWLFLGKLGDFQHLPCQIASWLYALKVAELGSGRQARDVEGVDLGVQVRR